MTALAALGYVLISLLPVLLVCGLGWFCWRNVSVRVERRRER